MSPSLGASERSFSRKLWWIVLSKVVKEAENVTTGLVISELCISVTVLALVSHKTAQILLSKDAQFPPKLNLAEFNIPLICTKSSISSNQIANDSYCTSPSTCTLCTPLLPTSPNWNAKRLSIDSDTTLINHNDDFVKDFSAVGLQDDSNCSSGDLLPGMKTIDDSSGASQQTQLQISARADTKSAHLAAVRDSIKRTHAKQLEHTTMINHLEQLHHELLIDQAALVDGWAVAMAQLGLASMLSPGPSLLHQTATPNQGTSIEIIQD
ncbi:hypothetical protein DFJ58DRAFT_841308 [Suillus subalutaceus]|uniref:uncharacterized protein n=1 Tax=Suillus subalutaceus TaxID=48586 RepID=UPI001B86975F|nr:uncharacterized protein DFJ58DRAFT_841308 [Suillus subalutaceus]KAG1854825.1 hypothetical protein DFJ58DRAFT_841308 [Suillus subalutaceus]